MWGALLCCPLRNLPVAGLLLGIGGSFTNETMLNTYGLKRGFSGPGTPANAILTVMNAAKYCICQSAGTICHGRCHWHGARKKRGGGAVGGLLCRLKHCYCHMLQEDPLLM